MSGSYSSSDDNEPIILRHCRKKQIKDESTDESWDESENEITISTFKPLSKHHKQLSHHSDYDQYTKNKTNKANKANISNVEPITNSLHNLSMNNNININNMNDGSPILLSARFKRKTQTKLTQFFTPSINDNNNNNKNKIFEKEISPKTALKGTPYHGLNTNRKNKYDDLSISDINRELTNCRDILNNDELINNLPDHGKKIKLKITLLDEALIRIKARNIIRDKNKINPVRQKLNFNFNSNPYHDRKYQNNTNNRFIPRGLAKNLDKNNLKDLVNSIESMSINPLNSVAPNNNHNNNNNDNIDDIKISKDLKATLYPHQIDGYQWMLQRETHSFDGQPFGGIIADEMGLGKTMQMISLMLHKHDIPYIDNNNNNKHKIFKHSNCTLIICPVSVMNHWETEIKKFTKKGRFIICRYHGNTRCRDIQRLTTNYNVIITTYGCIQSEWNEWKKLEDKRLNEMKDIRKQIIIYQRHQQRFGDLNDMTDIEGLKKLKMKLQILINKRYKRPILSQILYKRIVLDEAHQIKNYKSKTHRAVCDLYGKSYWFMTATPIQNTLDDLFAAFHFLRYKYYANYTNWKQGILNHSKGIQRIQSLLSIIMLRRLKKDYIVNNNNNNNDDDNKGERKCNDNDDDDNNNKKKKKLIQLPPKQSITHLIEFNEYERFIYKQLSCLMNKIFNGYKQNNSIGKNFSQCLKMLLQLRQCCNHLILIQNSVHRIHSILNGNDAQNMDINELLSVINNKGNIDKTKKQKKNDRLECSQEYLSEIKNALESGNDECPFCLDIMENVSITVCGHRFCTQCLNQIIDEREEYLQNKWKSIYSENKHLFIECPICRKKLQKTNITRIIKKNDKNEEYQKNANKNLFKPSSKLKKLMECLCDLHLNEPSSKCIIFSQWTSMLDIIENELKNVKYGYCRLDGKMTAINRSKSINKLNKDKLCWIMLISLKAGGVGLNLVAANHVFMMDIWWNPAIEDQALDRVHRIGQTKNVIIHRIIISNSVEQKVLALQDKKRKIAQRALDINSNNKKKKNNVNLSAKDLIDLFYDRI